MSLLLGSKQVDCCQNSIVPGQVIRNPQENSSVALWSTSWLNLTSLCCSWPFSNILSSWSCNEEFTSPLMVLHGQMDIVKHLRLVMDHHGPKKGQTHVTCYNPEYCHKIRWHIMTLTCAEMVLRCDNVCRRPHNSWYGSHTQNLSTPRTHSVSSTYVGSKGTTFFSHQHLSLSTTKKHKETLACYGFYIFLQNLIWFLHSKISVNWAFWGLLGPTDCAQLCDLRSASYSESRWVIAKSSFSRFCTWDFNAL